MVDPEIVKDDIFILHIETASDICSVALSNKSMCIAEKSSTPAFKHSKQLCPFIDDLLKENDLLPGQLSAISISEGPGSYTSLRIGTAAAKGLAFSLGIPLIAVSTLEAIARSHDTFDQYEFVVPMIDARRDEVYTSVYDAETKSWTDRYSHIIDTSSFEEQLAARKPILFIGNGAFKMAPRCQENNLVTIVDGHQNARNLVALAWAKFLNEDFVNTFSFNPFYLKSPNITVSKKQYF